MGKLFSKLKLRITFLYYRYYVLPEIAPNEKGKQVRFINSAYNTIHILTDDFFYKIAVSDPNTVKLEYENYLLASAYYNEFHKYLSASSFHQNRGFCFLRVEKLIPIEDSSECQQAALKILSCLKNYGSMRKVRLSNLPNIGRGIQLAKIYLKDVDWVRMYNLVDSYLQNNLLRVGPTHNDFHPKNIMKNNLSEPKIIDFDCFSSSGIQPIDSLYYQIEKQAQTLGYPSFPYLLDYCQNDASGISAYIDWDGDKRILSLLYYLNRIGQENSLFGIQYSSEDILKLMPSHV